MELGPQEDREKLWPGWDLNPHHLQVWSAVLSGLSYKVRWEQVVGIEGVPIEGAPMPFSATKSSGVLGTSMAALGLAIAWVDSELSSRMESVVTNVN